MNNEINILSEINANFTDKNGKNYEFVVPDKDTKKALADSYLPSGCDAIIRKREGYVTQLFIILGDTANDAYCTSSFMNKLKLASYEDSLEIVVY